MESYYSYNWRKARKILKVIGDTPQKVKVKKEKKPRPEKIKKVCVLGFGADCPKCKNKMESRKHVNIDDRLRTKAYFYAQWDYCKPCKHIQHYEKYKIYNPDYSEDLRLRGFLRELRDEIS